LRQDHHLFVERDTVVVAIGPEGREAFRRYWKEHDLPFIGLPDQDHRVLKLYGQQVNIFKLGRQPAQMLIDKNGTLRYVHYGQAMSDIPATKEMAALLDGLHAEYDS
jgi:peroxiredoxin